MGKNERGREEGGVEEERWGLKNQGREGGRSREGGREGGAGRGGGREKRDSGGRSKLRYKGTSK